VSELNLKGDASAMETANAVFQARYLLQVASQSKTPKVSASPAMAIFQAPPIKKAKTPTGAFVHALFCLLLTIAGVATVWNGNHIYGPEMYATNGMVPAAEAFAKGENYAVFDLNLNIRRLKDETVKRLPATPDVIILGASHWQEAHKGLLPNYNFYNAHVHRDYWEDLLGVTEILVSHNRLPK
jgi:hypothetical protein